MLQRLRRANLKHSPKKCTLFQREVTFLSYIVGSGGVRRDPQKVEEMEQWPVPSNVAELWSYLDLFTYYRRFVRDCHNCR